VEDSASFSAYMIVFPAASARPDPARTSRGDPAGRVAGRGSGRRKSRMHKVFEQDPMIYPHRIKRLSLPAIPYSNALLIYTIRGRREPSRRER